MKRQLEQVREYLALDIEAIKDVSKLEAYLDLLIQWSNRVDLVAPASREVLIERHIQDSYAAYLLIKSELGGELPSSCLDVGSGAGLPGLVFAILEPSASFFLCEPREKRQIFLREVISKLSLSNVELLHSRLEDLELSRKYDLICSRAIGMQDLFNASSRKLLNENGVVCQLLGPSWEGEASKVIDYSLYDGGPRRKLAFSC